MAPSVRITERCPRVRGCPLGGGVAKCRLGFGLHALPDLGVAMQDLRHTGLSEDPGSSLL